MSGRNGPRFLALPLATLAAAVFASTASAHAILDRTSPADGTNLSYAPAQLRLWFSEDISSRFRDIRVVDAGGRRVRASSIASPAGDSNLVVVRLPKLKRGTYGVLWRVLSADDGHVTGGNLAFGVRAASVATASDRSSGFSRLEALLRWLDFSLLAGVAGCIAVVALVLARIRPSPVLTAATLAVARARLLRAGMWFALLAGVAGIARLAWQSHELSSVGGSLADLAVQDRWGLLWLVRELALLALVGVLALPTNNRVSSPAIQCRMSVAGVLLVVAGAAHAATSHAAALDPRSPGAVVADAVHVLAAATWLGGVAALAIALWPAGTIGRTEASALARGCSRPFAELAAVGVGLVVATGLYSAGRQVASVDALLTTDYGHVLLLKTGVVVLVLGFGVVNFALLRSPARSRLAGSRPVILPEVLLGAAVFLAAAVLASSVPARGREFAPPTAPTAIERSSSVEDLLVTLSATPTRVGTNTFTALVASSRRPAPAPVTAVTLEVRNGGGAPETVLLSRVRPDRWFGTATLAETGRSEFAVGVQRASKRLRVPFAWSIGPADPARPVSFSTRPLAPLLTPISFLLLALTLAGAAWVLAGRPRPRRRFGGLAGRIEARMR